MSANAFSLCGKFLIAMPGMGDQRFEKALIFLCAHSDEGAMGFIVNKSVESPGVPDFFEQLEIISSAERPELPMEILSKSLHVGGPVEPGRGFVLHSPDFTSSSTLEVSDQVCLTATLDILRAIAMGRGPEKSLLALGYSGWSAGQLEDEIAANGWLTTEADAGLLFSSANERKYDQSLKSLGVDPALLSSSAGRA